MTSQYDKEGSELVSSLFKLSSKNGKLVKSNEYAAPADPNVTVRSWKMDEWKYYTVPSPFPTLARGLFTTEIKNDVEVADDRDRRYRIIVRGYDKFFNIGEVPWTNVRDGSIHHRAHANVKTILSGKH